MQHFIIAFDCNCFTQQQQRWCRWQRCRQAKSNEKMKGNGLKQQADFMLESTSTSVACKCTDCTVNSISSAFIQIIRKLFTTRSLNRFTQSLWQLIRLQKIHHKKCNRSRCKLAPLKKNHCGIKLKWAEGNRPPSRLPIFLHAKWQQKKASRSDHKSIKGHGTP